MDTVPRHGWQSKLECLAWKGRYQLMSEPWAVPRPLGPTGPRLLESSSPCLAPSVPVAPSPAAIVGHHLQGDGRMIRLYSHPHWPGFAHSRDPPFHWGPALHCLVTDMCHVPRHLLVVSAHHSKWSSSWSNS